MCCVHFYCFTFGSIAPATRYNKAEEFNTRGQKIFFHSDKKTLKPEALKPGTVLRQKSLAKALKLISRFKDKPLYSGAIAKDIVQTVKAHKGVISLEDLKNYKPRWLSPHKFVFNNYQVFTMPLPSSGGIILNRAFYLADQKNLNRHPFLSVNEWHIMGEILALAFRPRSQMGDLSNPSTYLQNWLSTTQLKKSSKKISLKKATSWPVLKDTVLDKKLVKEPTETTHFSIMNNQGLALSMTLTLNGSFGSFLVTDKYGIVLNNQMDDFNTKPGKPNQFGLIQGENNLVKKGKRPLSSMTPTILEQDGKTLMALGASGGPMIISAVFQTLYRSLVNKLELDRAIQTPRLHHQFLPRQLFVEKNRFSPEVLNGLKKRKQKIKQKNSIAKVYAVALGEDGLLEGGFDSRGEGAVGGL